MNERHTAERQTAVPPHKSRGTSLLTVLWQLLPAALLTAAFATVGVIHVMSRVEVVDSGYRLSQLESDSQRFQLENDRLKLELATLKSPSRLERVARETLQLAPPAAGSVLTVAAVPRAAADGLPLASTGSAERPVQVAGRLP